MFLPPRGEKNAKEQGSTHARRRAHLQPREAETYIHTYKHNTLAKVAEITQTIEIEREQRKHDWMWAELITFIPTK